MTQSSELGKGAGGVTQQEYGDTSATPALLSRRQIAAVVAGNGLDFYDFLTYSFFSVQIGKALFPTEGGHELLFSLATFGVGFLTRPIGSIVIGRIADTRGRRTAMLLSFVMMGFALIGLALTPGYATIGMAAPVLAICFRMLQGFALGGEVGPNTAYLLEAAPPHRRGFYTSLQYATQNAAVLLVGIVGVVLSSLLSPEALVDWGWRLAFLIGALIVPFALAIRRTLIETLEIASEAPSEAVSLNSVRRVAIAGGMVLSGATIAGYTMNYLNVFAEKNLHIATTMAFSATVVLGLTGIVADLVAGWLSDRYGRKAVLVPANIAQIVMMAPAFSVMVYFHNGTALLAMTALLSITAEFASGPALTLMTEALPARVRAGTLGTIYAVGIGIFGGSAQFIDQWLIDVTHDPMAPAWYTTAALMISMIGVLMLREAGRGARKRHAAQPAASVPAA